jgi:hypothetical protein
MKRLLLFLLVMNQCLLFAQTGSKRSNGDLLTGTWRCVKCKDSTLTTIAFLDKTYRCTAITPEGLKVTECKYKIKGSKIFIQAEDGKKWRHKIVLIDQTSLELKNWKRGNETFRKTR